VTVPAVTETASPLAATATANAPVGGTESITIGAAATIATIGSTITRVVAGQTSLVVIVPANTNNPTPSGTETSQSGGPNIGAIVGGVVGGVAALAILIAILFCVYNRGHRQGRNVAAAVGRHDCPPDDSEDQEILDLEKEAMAPPAVIELRNRTGEVNGGRVQHPENDVEPPVDTEVPSGRLNYPDFDFIGGRTEK
jgi:hypothetical protein